MSEITLMPGIGICATGLEAESRRMEVIANNVANAQTTRGPDGKVFRRQDVVFGQKLNDAFGKKDSMAGVEIRDVVEDNTPGRRVYRPGHPDAGPDGYIEMPNVNTVAEMVDMMSSSRAFEANLSAMKTSRTMATKALGILNGNH
ncbi:MAG: flagellar basal body rod protein FlgC [Pontiellaceae bacterium]|nr:flagellar basal body rod protein FlgC [Pontiellaceae bacterium]MBN2784108.1 flagellar basal body rod protein FlgC [Pontiellaceae bacterium]